jgi:hypothetical protein
MNWFLYLVTDNFVDEDGELIRKGEAGVGQCSMSPGIVDAPYGIMYIITEQDIKAFFKKHRLKTLKPHNVRRAIEAFYFCIEKKKEDPAEVEFVFD